MPLESAPQNPLGRIDVSALAPQASPVVEPRAVMALNEAYRQGVITANDIHDRMIQRPVVEGQAKIMGSPDVLAAQKSSILSGAQSAQLQNQAQQLALKQAQLKASMPPVISQMNDELQKHGLAVRPDADLWTKGDSEKVLETWHNVEQWKTETATNKAQLEMLKPTEIATPEGGVNQVVVAEKSQRIPPSENVAAAENFQASFPNPGSWISAGKPAAPKVFDTAPGTMVPGPTAPAGNVPAPAGAPQVAVKAAGTFPAPGKATSSVGGLPVKPPGADMKAPTDPEIKAANFVARSLTANEVFSNLDKAGFNPGSVQNWAQELLIGPLAAFKTADQREYESAKSSWAQGLLRLESGASISNKEEGWYLKTFFPAINDPPAVQQQKAKMRSDVEKIADSVAKSGRLDAGALLGVRERAEAISAITSAPAHAARTVNISGLGQVTLQQDANGRTRIVPLGQSGQPSSAASYVPPATLGAGGKPSVEPKRKGPKIEDEPMRELPSAQVEPKDDTKSMANNLIKGFRRAESKN